MAVLKVTVSVTLHVASMVIRMVLAARTLATLVVLMLTLTVNGALMLTLTVMVVLTLTTVLTLTATSRQMSKTTSSISPHPFSISTLIYV